MEFEVLGGYVKYEGNVITGFGGRIEKLIIPPHIHIETIAKKAFFGAKNLSEVYLGESVKTIGEWAFASCSSLKVFKSLSKPSFSMGVFLNDDNLEEISLQDGEDYSALLSVVCTKMDAEYLLSAEDVGSSDWYIRFDTRLLEILNEDDSVGYEKHVLCGEEDLLFDINVYIAQNRKRKALLCYIRLLNAKGLNEDFRSKFENYLKNTSCGDENESGFLVLCDHGSERAYIDLFLELGMLREDNFESILLRLGPRETTLKSAIIKYHDENSKSDYFSDMFL